MSLVTNISSLATRIATELKSVRTLINGNTSSLSALTTTDKSNLVSAINEIKAATSSAAGINDTTPSTSTTYSSSKTDGLLLAQKNALLNGAGAAFDTLKEFQDALGSDPNFATTTATALGNRVRFDASQTLTAPQAAQARTNIGAAFSTDVGDTATNFVTVFEAGLA